MIWCVLLVGCCVLRVVGYDLLFVVYRLLCGVRCSVFDDRCALFVVWRVFGSVLFVGCSLLLVAR